MIELLKLLKLFPLLIFLFSFENKVNAQDFTEDQYMDSYIVILDTSQNYNELYSKMGKLSDFSNTAIDLLGRSFDTTKQLICLPENSEDEIYAGEYFPRRYPSETLSLEYFYYYKESRLDNENTIALVVMITDSKQEAEIKLAELKKYSNTSFILNCKIYRGCMH